MNGIGTTIDNFKFFTISSADNQVILAHFLAGVHASTIGSYKKWG